MITKEKETTVVGKRLNRLDGPEKVTGKFIYGADLDAPGLLHCKVFRSSIPHGRIKRLDISKALAYPGVRTIMTADDIPSNIRHGHTVKDEVVFARDYVRYYGEPIAAIAADTREIGEEALKLIEIEFEELPVINGPEEALKPDAPLLHPDWESYNGNPDVVRYDNVCGHTTINTGDVEKAFAEADYVFEDRFTTHMVHQGYLEARAGMAHVEADGTVVIASSTQFPFGILGNLSDILQLPTSKIRVSSTGVGGGFGGKLDLGVEHFVALLARKTGRPVKYLWDREEEMKAAAPRQEAVLYVKTGVMKDGTITARQAKILFGAGAYTGDSSVICSVGAMLARGAYNIPNYKVDSLAVYTNKANCGAYRGPSAPQTYYAIETHLDKIANELNIDKVEIRQKNGLKDGDLGPTGQVIETVSLQETITKVSEQIGMDQPRPKYTGRGIATAIWTSAGGSSCAYVQLNDDGTVVLITGGKEIGTGAITMGVAQIVAEELGIDITDVRLITGDTHSTPYDFGAQGGRTTFNVGNASRIAAQDAKRQLFVTASEKLNVPVERLELKDKQVYDSQNPTNSINLAEIAADRMWNGGPIIGRGSYIIEPTEYDVNTVKGSLYPVYNFPSFHTQAAEVEIDPDTGEVTVKRYVVAQDVGYAINPDGAEGQMTGGVVQGIGYALSEEIVYKDGVVLNPNMTDFKMPTIMDVPRIETILVESPSTAGPYGAKGVGEAPIILPAAAISNAVADAIGVHIHDLPITAEKVLRAIKEKESKVSTNLG
ncbi:xanthine dehydrogenase family protein molybdopterin-binding subunit [Alkalihalobacterium alkalinitrilicum]|uniref:xanthine dehydrogenase family protein molybdopterin-binding subunit n=1 Tax=Alkalihalobacterium alkalinitrilicum TaxID=427920 RepID=UPI00099517ED|nr:xanthine dehydrogenase family protein molybdopterin-binding subunit [Alkalihalobacterium alkalinitrilicum]